MDSTHSTVAKVEALLVSINDFITNTADSATYNAPIIDWHHPDSYKQPTIAGLKKFLSGVETEKGYLDTVISNATLPRDLATNAPHLIAVWEEVQRADWPLGCISQVLECPDGSQIKVDVVAKGGEEWVKVNTMRESRLMAEFREHDSYCNSDYSDSESESCMDKTSGSRSGPRLTNSAIQQVASLVHSAQSYPRLPHLPPPKVKYVFNRLEENPEGGYADPRVKETFDVIRSLGAELVLASDTRKIPSRIRPSLPAPSTNILLDLSVVVALCCDSTHLRLPVSPQELEARFRPLVIDLQVGHSLAPHVPVTKDLRDQLRWEMQQPLIQEMQDRLSRLDGKPQLWVTAEVLERLPKIANIIGGEDERRRARALFSGEEDFWTGSRWEGKAGLLTDIKVNVLSDGQQSPIDLAALEGSPFKLGFASVCQMMLDIVEEKALASTLPAPPPAPRANKNTSNRAARRIQPAITVTSRLPSAHTIRTFLAGIKNDMTVLTNNRGAVGKVVREMGVNEGLAYGEDDMKGKAAVWVVNPSSLSEWRRREVEAKNKELIQGLPGRKRDE